MSRQEETPPATAAAVAGLAGEVEALRRRLEPVEGLPRRVDQLAHQVDELAGYVKSLTPSAAAADEVPSWLVAPADEAATRGLLDELVAWLEAVLLRYTDAAAALPDCWAWHPDVVEELLWLMQAWLAAYQGVKASVGLVGDWHDRYRPGVVKRIKATVGSCSLENHTAPAGPPRAPIAEAVGPVAAWWAGHRDQAPPAPTEEHLAAAAPRRRMAGGVRR